MTGKVTAAEGIWPAKPKEISIEAVVTHADGRVERLGTVSFYHRNPLRRALWRVGRWLRGDFI
jgi:hypothetical protein